MLLWHVSRSGLCLVHECCWVTPSQRRWAAVSKLTWAHNFDIHTDLRYSSKSRAVKQEKWFVSRQHSALMKIGTAQIKKWQISATNDFISSIYQPLIPRLLILILSTFAYEDRERATIELFNSFGSRCVAPKRFYHFLN